MKKECTYGASQHVHSQHGSGAVIRVVSRESGGAVRAPGNAGDKRVKRKHGSRSAAAVAARIERGYLKRTRTASRTTMSPPEEREQMAAAIQQLDGNQAQTCGQRGTGTRGNLHPGANSDFFRSR